MITAALHILGPGPVIGTRSGGVGIDDWVPAGAALVHAACEYGSHTARGGSARPPGSNSPVSSKRTTPLQSRLQPCSG
jgi:hypothetical protein